MEHDVSHLAANPRLGCVGKLFELPRIVEDGSSLVRRSLFQPAREVNEILDLKITPGVVSDAWIPVAVIERRLDLGPMRAFRRIDPSERVANHIGLAVRPDQLGHR